jgi:uncharacterized protein DUF6249
VREPEIVLIFGLACIMAGVVIIVLTMRNRRLYREMEHRERLAMIEHRVMPAPEQDPVAFERALGTRMRIPDAAGRARSAGIMMIALGVGFAFLVTFAAGQPGVGIGVGGGFAILGVGFFLNALLSSGRDRYMLPTYTPPGYAPRAPIRPDQQPPPPQ